MRPWVGLRNLVRRLKQVVLPAPFGPINAWIVPRSTWRFTPLTATKPANSLVRSSVARIVWLPIRRDNSPCPGPIYGGNGRIVQYRDREIGAGIAQQLAGATKFGCRPARGLRSHQRLGGGTGFAQKRRQLVGGGRYRRPRRQRNLDDARQFRRLLARAQRRQEIYQSAEAAFVPFAADAGVTGVDERRLVTRLLAFDRMADRLHVAHALFTQDLLHAPDRIALAVEQMPNAAQEIDVVVAIVAPAAAAFQRLDLSEAGFPEAQDMLRQVEVIGDLADGTERVWSFFHVRSRPPACSAFLAVALAVDTALHDVRRFEHHDASRLDRHFLAGLRVAADPAAFVAHDERAERGKLHVLAARETVGNFMQDQFHQCGRFGAREPDLLINHLAQICTR